MLKREFEKAIETEGSNSAFDAQEGQIVSAIALGYQTADAAIPGRKAAENVATFF